MHYSYSIAEASEALCVCTNTVRNWIKTGLPTLRPRGELLILGGDLKDFLARRERERKRPCPPGAMYCFRCNTPRTPPPELVEAAEIGVSLKLLGICPSCGGLMHRTVSLDGAQIAGFAETIARYHNHLSDNP